MFRAAVTIKADSRRASRKGLGREMVQLESAEFRMALFRSAERRPGGQRYIRFKRYKAKKRKPTFQEYMRA